MIRKVAAQLAELLASACAVAWLTCQVTATTGPLVHALLVVPFVWVVGTIVHESRHPSPGRRRCVKCGRPFQHVH